MTDMIETPPSELWDRIPGEDADWYRRFLIYRDLGVGRNMLAVYKQELETRRARADKKGGNPNSVPENWRKNARLFKWEERYQAWASHQLEQQKREQEEDRLKAREQRQKTLRALGALLNASITEFAPKKTKDGEVIPTKAPDAKTMHQLAQSAAVIFKESRIEYGEPGEIVDMTSGGEKIVQGPSMDDMATLYKEIRAWEEQQRNGGSST